MSEDDFLHLKRTVSELRDGQDAFHKAIAELTAGQQAMRGLWERIEKNSDRVDSRLTNIEMTMLREAGDVALQHQEMQLDFSQHKLDDNRRFEEVSEAFNTVKELIENKGFTPKTWAGITGVVTAVTAMITAIGKVLT